MVDTPVVEIRYDGVWQDITERVTGRGSWVEITRGRGDEMTRSRPARLSLSLDNRDGMFAPRNPASPLFGKIGRNTPIRVRFTPPQSSLQLDGGGYASTPDDPALDITGDHDFRLGLHPRVWRASSEESARGLARKYRISGDQRSWAITLRDDGTIRLLWSPDGTLASRIAATSTAAIPADTDDVAIRITLDVDNGASGNDVTFYTAATVDDLGGGPSETQLGSTVTTAGVTSVHAGTADVELGRVNPGGLISSNLDGTLDAFELRDGIGGTVVTGPDFTALDVGTDEFEDSAGHTWTVHSPAHITDPQVRFSGEVSQWPQRWTSELDVWVPLEAAGILRRLSQGQQALRSAMYRGVTGQDITSPVGYWPMEGGSESTELGSAFDGHPAMSVSGDVDPAVFSDAPATDAIPTFGTGYTVASVPPYSGHDFLRSMVFVSLPDQALASDTRVMQVITRGSARRWLLNLFTTGSLEVRAFDRDGSLIFASTIGFNLQPGVRGLMWLFFTQNGADLDWQVGFQEAKSGAAVVVGGDTLAGHTIGRCTKIRLGAGTGGDLEGMAIGHLVVQNVDEFWEIAPFARAWAGEAAIERIRRLCAEEDVPLRVTGSESDRVGPQLPDKLLNLTGDAADVDLGPLGDARDVTAVHYRARHTLYSQAALVLDYEAGQAWRPLEPTDDDQAIRNDVTVTRVGGSSARATRESGSMSIQAPPDGVGRYSSDPTLNLADDGQLADQAGWRLHLGTVDEQRVPTLTVLLHAPAVAELVDDVLALDVGDRIQIINTPAWLPGSVDLLVQGYTEHITGVEHRVVYTCSPASPWRTGSVSDGADEERVDTDGSQLAADADSSATTLPVLTTVGPLWTEDAAEFPLDCKLGGEVVSVSDIGPAADDSFTRTESSGWGAADSGQGWQLAGGAASDYSVDGAQGLVSLGSVGTSRRTILPEPLRDVDVRASVATDAVATGAWITAGLAVRRPDSSNYYLARVEFKDTGPVGLNIYKSVSGSLSAIAAGVELPSYAADERFNVRFSVIGSSLRAKLWRVVGESEPDWQLEVTDTDLTAGANLATHNELLSGNSNTLPVVLSWDDLDSQNQLFTVTRSVNGVEKAQSAGADVRLAQPLIIGL